MKLDRKLAETISALAEKGKKKKNLTYEEIVEDLNEFSLEQIIWKTYWNTSNPWV